MSSSCCDTSFNVVSFSPKFNREAPICAVLANTIAFACFFMSCLLGSNCFLVVTYVVMSPLNVPVFDIVFSI